MTIIEKIHELVNDTDWDKFDFGNAENASPEKLIIMGYYIGLEEATKDISDKYHDLIAEQRKRANDSRYHRLANEIIGDKNYIYSPNYAGEMTEAFGHDKV